MECTKLNCPMQVGTVTENCGDSCPWRTTAKLDDLISRAALLRECEERQKSNPLEDGRGWADHFLNDAQCPSTEWNSVEEMIEGMPAVDAVPVVRCKDCKHRPVDHRDEYNDATGLSIEFPDYHCPCQCEDGWYNWYPEDYWFCADGERRDDE